MAFYRLPIGYAEYHVDRRDPRPLYLDTTGWDRPRRALVRRRNR